MYIAMEEFQSTLPMRGVTHCTALDGKDVRFQSTLPMRGVTFPWRMEASFTNHFNPHSPCGE